MRRIFPIAILLLLGLTAAAEEKTVEQLKAEAEHAEPGQKGRLYAEIAEKLVAVADKQFTYAESIKGHATVQEILQYAIKSHELATETRKKMKETEKSLLEFRRSHENKRRTLAEEDRPSIEAV